MEGEGSCSEGGDEAIIDYPRTKEKGRSTLAIILCCVSTPRCVPPNLGSIRSHSHHELYPSRLNLVHKFHKFLKATHASCSVSEARRKGCCLSPKLFFSLSLFFCNMEENQKPGVEHRDPQYFGYYAMLQHQVQLLDRTWLPRQRWN